MNAMPQGMIYDMESKNNRDKADMLISCLHNTYVPEWQAVYVQTVKFIYTMFDNRAKLYDNQI